MTADTYRLRSPRRIVKNFLEHLTQEIRVDAAYLFGSSARKERCDASDVDLVVLSWDVKELDFTERSRLVARYWRYTPFADVYLLTPREWNQRQRESLIVEEMARETVKVW